MYEVQVAPLWKWTCWVPGLGCTCKVHALIQSSWPLGRWAPCAHFTDEQTEAQLVKVCPRSQGRRVAELAPRLHAHLPISGGVGQRACPGVRRAGDPHGPEGYVALASLGLSGFQVRKGLGASSAPRYSVPGSEPGPESPASAPFPGSHPSHLQEADLELWTLAP